MAELVYQKTENRKAEEAKRKKDKQKAPETDLFQNGKKDLKQVLEE